ncbi:hypothetical protein ACLOJK_020258 [Asimina triloba]
MAMALVPPSTAPSLDLPNRPLRQHVEGTVCTLHLTRESHCTACKARLGLGKTHGIFPLATTNYFKVKTLTLRIAIDPDSPQEREKRRKIGRRSKSVGMEDLKVMLTYPNPLMEKELEKRCNKVFKLWQYSSASSRTEFLKNNSHFNIRALVGNAHVGADADVIDALPQLEIVASHSVGIDKIDLGRCRERGIRVTNTPNVLTDDVADTAMGLILATLRKICPSDRYVREGKWKETGNFQLTSKGIFRRVLEKGGDESSRLRSPFSPFERSVMTKGDDPLGVRGLS